MSANLRLSQVVADMEAAKLKAPMLKPKTLADLSGRQWLLFALIGVALTALISLIAPKDQEAAQVVAATMQASVNVAKGCTP